ncbi:hypothetical protein H4Q32_019152 [Labeo rohita]|uniref:ribonuclease H n=1 Tax=Labeo rohita TaxID=84645 RepID=A0ABQ8LKE5_LABRO|nr:hypothetical protein H4Q32_019152 [Labeo rohita]
MAILQVHQAKALKELHQGGPDPRLMQELRTATDFALQQYKRKRRRSNTSCPAVNPPSRWVFGLCLLVTEGAPLQLLHLLHLLRYQKWQPLNPGVEQAAGEWRSQLFRAPLRTPASPQSGPDLDNPVMEEIARRGTLTSVPPLPREGRESVSSLLPPTRGSVVPIHLQKEQFSQSLGLSPRDQFMSDALLPQIETRSVISPPSREPLVKVRAVHRNLSPERFVFWVGVTFPRAAPPQSSPARLSYAIQFTRRPPRFRGILFPFVHSDTDASVLRAEIAVLLAKNVIEPIPPAEMQLGFYSPYFIVPKKSGGLRPILDLCVLNRSLHRLPFKMLTAKCILSCVRHQNWFAAIDLKDAYFHVSILPRHRPFLRFAFAGRAYQYKVLPFGLALSPCVFTKLAEGLQVNWEKSKLSPVQNISFLEAPGAYGSRSCSYATRAAPYETALALAVRLDPAMGMAPWHFLGRRYPGMSPPLQLPSLVATHPPSPPLESDAAQIAACCSHSGRAESCSRCATAYSPRRMATPPSSRPLEPPCVASGRDTVDLTGLIQAVINTITQARAPSTRQAYALKWGLFAHWCSSRREDPQRCVVGVVLSFLQEKSERRLSPSTLKVYVAAIAAYHDVVDGLSLGKHHLIVRFLRGARTLNPPRPHLIPSWDLSMVLLGLRRVPFESFASVELKYLSLKTVLLIALTSINSVGDLHAFSVSETCLEFGPADSHVTLRPRPSYVPKVPITPFRDQVVNLQALPREEAYPAFSVAVSCSCITHLRGQHTAPL